MPVHKVKGGWQWGNHGKIYANKADAEKQGRAAYANGYRGDAKTRTSMALDSGVNGRYDDLKMGDCEKGALDYPVSGDGTIENWSLGVDLSEPLDGPLPPKEP